MKIIYSSQKFGAREIMDRCETATLEVAVKTIIANLPPARTSINLKSAERIRLLDHIHGTRTCIDIVGTVEEMVELHRFCILWKQMRDRREELLALRYNEQKEAKLKTSPKPERSSNQASAKRGHRGTPQTNTILKEQSEEATLLDLRETECAALAYLNLFSDDFIEPFHLLPRERLLELVIYKMTTPEATLEDLRILAA